LFHLKQSEKSNLGKLEYSILQKGRGKIKSLELIRGRKEVQDNLPFTYDSIKIENKNKEVPECQLVITS